MLKIHSIETFWTHEWPWIRTVVFVQGCNFKCIYCHNPDTICTDGWKEVTDDYIIDWVLKNRPYFWKNGWLTVSWWEVLLQARHLLPIFKRLKEEWIHIAIDTNGSLLTNTTKELLEYVDLVLLDIKHINSKMHEKITGVPNEQTLKFADYLNEIGKHVWLRYVYVPGYTDSEEYIEELGERFGHHTNIERIEILPYHNLGEHKWDMLGWEYKLKNIFLPEKHDLERARKILVKHFWENRVFVRF